MPVAARKYCSGCAVAWKISASSLNLLRILQWLPYVLLESILKLGMAFPCAAAAPDLRRPI
jgi:hypothetical protein